MRNLIRTRFLRLLFTGILLWLVSILNSPIAAAQTLFASTSTTPQPIQQTITISDPDANRTKLDKTGVAFCRISRSVDVYEQPSKTSKRTATVEKGDFTELVLTEENANSRWLHIAGVIQASGKSQLLSGYVFNGEEEAPQKPMKVPGLIQLPQAMLMPAVGACAKRVVLDPVGAPNNPGRPQSLTPTVVAKQSSKKPKG